MCKYIYIYIYIHIYINICISNWIIGHAFIYLYAVNVNFMLICTELPKKGFIVNMPENSRYLKLYILFFRLSHFFQSISLKHIKNI